MVASDAFGPGQPRRDLFLSPDHAVYVGAVLVPAKYLINGTSITQVMADEVTYHHVELPRHDVLLAEGLPAESYLDLGDRSNFANGGGGGRTLSGLRIPCLGSARLRARRHRSRARGCPAARKAASAHAWPIAAAPSRLIHPGDGRSRARTGLGRAATFA